MSKFAEISAKYLQNKDGLLCFCGDDSLPEVAQAASRLAGLCPTYRIDVEEEIYCEETFTCYNCRYRRWVNGGFSCMKRFPIP